MVENTGIDPITSCMICYSYAFIYVIRFANTHASVYTTLQGHVLNLKFCYGDIFRICFLVCSCMLADIGFAVIFDSHLTNYVIFNLPCAFIYTFSCF